jgi:outer membrane protein TolC
MKVTILAVTAVVLAAAAGEASAQPLGVEQAVSLALRDNPRLQAGRARLQAAREVSSSTSRRRLPGVHVSEEAQRFDKPFAIAFPSMGAPAAEAPVFVARERNTSTLAVSADQPLLGLGRLTEETAALEESAAATAADVAALEAAVRQAVQLGFLRHFEARALQQIAQSSAAELDDQQQVAKARLASGVITEADLLRIQVALANARQQGIVAGAEAETARVNVLAVLGRGSDGAGVTLVEPTTLLTEAGQPAPPLDQAMASARQRRPELAADQHRSEAAAHTARARRWALAPEVDLEAAYLRVDGQVFAPKNSAYVGVKAQWAVWEWGASWKQERAALAQAAAVRLDGEDRVRQVEAELAGGLAQDQAAPTAVAAAQTAIAGAEEAYRETNAQVKAGAATTTDLLEAQSALNQARLNLTRARYALASNHVQLRRAQGD